MISSKVGSLYIISNNFLRTIVDPKPLAYEPPVFPSLYWPFPVEGTQVQYLYDSDSIWRFTLYWTLICVGGIHLVAASYAVIVQAKNWRLVWVVPVVFLIIGAIEATIAGNVVGGLPADPPALEKFTGYHGRIDDLFHHTDSSEHVMTISIRRYSCRLQDLDQRVSGQLAPDLSGPDIRRIITAVEDGALHADDDHAPERQLAKDFVDGPFADEEFFKHVGETVARRADEREQVAFDGVGGGSAVGPRDVVRGYQDAETATAHQYANVLRNMVANFQEDQRDEDDDGDGPEVDELRGEDGGVLIGVDGEVVTLDVAEGENEIAPAVPEHKAQPALEAVFDDRGRGVDQRQQDVRSATAPAQTRTVELRGEDGGVLIGVDGEVVTLDVAEGENEIAPAVPEHKAQPALEAVFDDRGRGVDQRQQDVSEQRLEGRVDRALLVEEGRQRARARVGDGQDLRQRQHKPELLRLEVPELATLALHLGHRRLQRRLVRWIGADHVHDAVPGVARGCAVRAVQVERGRRSFGPHGLDVHRFLLEFRHLAQVLPRTRRQC
nr:uncharacterized protein CFP56_07977 [Quercus suber]